MKCIASLYTSVRLFLLIWSPAETLIGSLYGAFQAYARALFAELIPMGEEARWYGLFSITDKVSLFVQWAHIY